VEKEKEQINAQYLELWRKNYAQPSETADASTVSKVVELETALESREGRLKQLSLQVSPLALPSSPCRDLPRTLSPMPHPVGVVSSSAPAAGIPATTQNVARATAKHVNPATRRWKFSRSRCRRSAKPRGVPSTSTCARSRARNRRPRPSKTRLPSFLRSLTTSHCSASSRLCRCLFLYSAPRPSYFLPPSLPRILSDVGCHCLEKQHAAAQAQGLMLHRLCTAQVLVLPWLPLVTPLSRPASLAETRALAQSIALALSLEILCIIILPIHPGTYAGGGIQHAR